MVLKSYLRVASGVFCMNVGFQFCTFKIVGGRVHSSMLFYKQPFSWFFNPSRDFACRVTSPHHNVLNFVLWPAFVVWMMNVSEKGVFYAKILLSTRVFYALWIWTLLVILPLEWLPTNLTSWILGYGQYLWCWWWMYQKEVYFMQKYFSQQEYFMLYEFEPFSWFCL